MRSTTSVWMCLWLVSACAADDGGQTGARGGIGKADLWGSCSAEDCGGPASSGVCWCDDACSEWGDCCENKEVTCDAAPTCQRNTDCPAGEYCEASGCEEPGICMPIPEPGTVMCGAYAGPYCDCDGSTQYTTSTCVYDRIDHWGSCE